jgi:tellurite resistance protein TerC
MEIWPFFTEEFLGKPTWMWLSFLAIVVFLLAFDLGVLHRKSREIPVGESFALSAGYITIALIFGAWVWYSLGATSGMDYLTGFFVEKSLSLDNVFVISLIFATLAIPSQYQYRVLFYGILGVIVMRALLIGLGTSIVAQFTWVLFLFGGFLVLTGIKMMFVADDPGKIARSRVLRAFKKALRVTSSVRGRAFIVHELNPQTGRKEWHGTPLLLALVMIEFVDFIFAVDSVPAILAITTDPFIVYTSNIFAILGLRALYFALAASVHRFHYLKYALALVLIFIGGKIFANQIWGKIDPAISLGVTFGLLAGGILYSLWKTRGISPPAAAGPSELRP